MGSSSIKLLLLVGLLMTAAMASNAPNTPQSTPEARVRAFITDYYRRHDQSARIIDAGDFDAWDKVIGTLVQAHFVAGAHSGMGGSMSSTPDHHPDTEEITSSSVQGEGVQIQTHDPKAPLTRYYEYDLRQVAGDWRIVSLRGYVESPDEPFMTPAQQEQFRNPATLALRALPKGE